MFYHILTSIIGAHACKQDAVKYFEDEERIIAVVADGLGSKRKSAYGARLICNLIVEELRTARLPVQPPDIGSPHRWYGYLDKKNWRHDDCSTTCSYAVIDKGTRQVSVGQIGDSPVFICIDNKPIVEIKQQKDFSNVTDCLGGKAINSFATYNYSYTSTIKVLVTSDGIGDELDSSTLDALFSYLISKYQNFSRKSRSRRFTKEMKATIGQVNHDDKSAIYIWST